MRNRTRRESRRERAKKRVKNALTAAAPPHRRPPPSPETHWRRKGGIGERRELLLSKGVKREKWDEEMKEKGPHSPYIAAHDPNPSEPTQLKPSSFFFVLFSAHPLVIASPLPAVIFLFLLRVFLVLLR